MSEQNIDQVVIQQPVEQDNYLTLDQQIEILSKKPTQADVEKMIETKVFLTVDESIAEKNGISQKDQKELVLTTICILLLKNGSKVVGEAHAHNQSYYSKEDGEKYSYLNALAKLYPIMTNDRRNSIVTLNGMKATLALAKAVADARDNARGPDIGIADHQ